ncbi:DUF2752 domain-containing protein [Butyrivibrio sp. INlla16]|uniref:DUF2752 domain-containing protein n=1 Tax=Butyrivibrio sp. INlla16 TaxID=1520807 RepID=UPI0008879C33|nr:DUF2752 domain-containing protein [Butyrivibrio sp. INlla16]SDB40914.1 Protein of unknown function [Butyrivibrio sp. INlla16]
MPREKMALIKNRIKEDIRHNGLPILVIVFAWFAVTLIFHRFCPMVIVTGFPCPGCGMTRALISFITLHPIRAMQYNPSYPFWIVVLIIGAYQRYVQGKSFNSLKYPLIIVGCITIGVYVWRLTHSFPSTEPMVYTHQNVLAYIYPEYDRLILSLFR